MQIDPYLSFKGTCEQAFKFYERCLGGQIAGIFTYGDSPMAGETPPEWHKKIMHARLVVGDNVIMGSDSPPQYQEDTKGFSVSLGIDNAAEAERVFNALSENATIKMPLQQTFWAYRFGMLIDQFGVPWMVNCEKEG